MSGLAEGRPDAAARPSPQAEAPDRPKRSRRMVVAAGVLLAVFLIGGAWFGLNRAAVLSGTPDIPTIALTRGDFVRQVIAEGNLEAVEATLLGPPPTSRGQMRIAWLAPDGIEVREGDVVIRFDPSDMEQKLREGESEHRTAESRIHQKTVREEAALKNLDRDADMAVKELEHTSSFTSKDPEIYSRVEIIESEIDVDLAGRRKSHAEEQRGIREELSEIELALLDIQKGKAQLQIDEARTGLSDLEVRAPHDGIFMLRDFWGRTPAVGVVVWGGNPVAEIPRLEAMQAKVYVLEADAGGLEVGLPATVALEAHPGREFAATIKSVDALAMKRNNETPVQYFGVVLELARQDPSLMKPGQRVQATLNLARATDVVSVPRQAVFERDGERVVFVERSGRFEPVEVTLGATGLGRVVVEQGLAAGDRVALRAPDRPDDGFAAAEGAPAAGPLEGTP